MKKVSFAAFISLFTMLILIHHVHGADVSKSFDPSWITCSKAQDCILTREGTGCGWTSVNKTYAKVFSEWDGYVHRKKGASGSCQKNLEIKEDEMKAECINGACISQKK